MYLYVVIREENECSVDIVLKDKENIESATGEDVLIVPYKKFTIEMINKLNPKDIIFSGFAPDLDTFDKKYFYTIEKVVKEVKIPILCICGSHQLLSEIYNKDIYNEDKLYNYPIKPEKNCKGEYYKTNGFYTINLLSDDEIFNEMNKKTKMKCLHYCEVKELPKDFVLLASSLHSKVEAMKHREKFIYSTQFHPEKYDINNIDGKKFLKNFSNMVDKYWKEE